MKRDVTQIQKTQNFLFKINLNRKKLMKKEFCHQQTFRLQIIMI